MKISNFKVGDEAITTTKLWRRDKKTVLEPGVRGRVTEVFQGDNESPQIVRFEVPGRMPIGDIVVVDDKPLRKV